MKTQLPSLLLYLFYGMTATVFLYKFVRGKEWKTHTLSQLKSSWLPFALSVVPIAAALFFGKYANVDMSDAWLYFTGAAAVGYVLSQIGLSAQLRSILLLQGAVCVTLLHPTDNALLLTATIGGLAVWKLMENLLHKPESRLDDITAPIVWLATCYYSTAEMGEKGAGICQALVMATLTVSMFIRGIEPVLLPNDSIFLKRVMLSLTGGLAMLILITKVLLVSRYSVLAAVAGTGFFISYLLQALDKNVDEGPTMARGLKNILLVGIATLAATRLYGMQGVLILAATTIVGPSTGSAVIAGLFWVSRVLVQGYVVQYVGNVTGINLMHTYSSAAMYAGFLFVIVASLFIRDFKNRKTLSAILLASTVILPCAANYFLHPEPAGSFLVALGVTSVLMTFLSPALFPTRAADQESLMVMPVLATSLAVLGNGLSEAGDTATNETRIVALCWIGFVVVCIALVDRFVFSDRSKKPKSNEAPPATPDAAA